MKRKIALTLVVLMLLVASIGLVACDKTAPTPVTVTIFIGEVKFENVKGYSNENLFDHINTICVDNKLALNYSGSAAYGAYISEIGNLKADANSFICIYTSDEKSKDVSEWATTITKNGATLYSSGLGASSLKLIDGGVYSFDLVEMKY